MSASVATPIRRNRPEPGEVGPIIELTSSLGTWFFAGAISVLVLILTGNIWLALASRIEASFIAVYSSEGVVDSFGALACLLAMFVFASAFLVVRWTEQESSSGRPAAAWCYLLLAVSCFVMVGEEISWAVAPTVGPTGETLDWTLARLVQPRTGQFPVAMGYWAGTLIGWLVIAPILVRWMPSAGRYAQRHRLPVPSRAISRWTLATCLLWVILAFRPGLLLFGPDTLEEPFEASLEWLLLIWAVEEYARCLQWAKRRWSPVLLALIALGLAIGGYQIVQQFVRHGLPASRSHQLFRLALAVDADQEPTKAIELYRQAIAEFELNDSANYGLALILHRQGRLAEAIPYYEKAVLIAPYCWEYHEAVGVAYMNMVTGNSFRRALPHLEKAMELLPPNDPHRADLMLMRERILAFKRAGQEALKVPEVKAKVDEFRQWRQQKIRSVDPNS
jgi:hypothetical protein